MKTRLRRLAPWAALLPLLALALAPLVAAVESDPIQARQQAMEGVGGAIKALAAIAKQQAPFDAAVVKSQATTIATHLDAAKDLFPEGSHEGSRETWAMPMVWETYDDFQAKMKAGHDAAIALATVTDEAAFPAALGALGGACKSCHESYRRPKE